MSELSVVLDHADFLVIDKPPGIPVHKDENSAGIIPLACASCGCDQLWLVHRLDKATSGLLMLAKNAQAAAELSKHFADHKIAKTYIALSDQKPSKKQGKVVGDMQRSRRASWRLCRSNDNPAITRFSSQSIAPGLRAFYLFPQTGKTHQLRVAMKSLGAPILGDAIYRKVDSAKFDRLYLHAAGLRFGFKQQEYALWCPPNSGKLFQQYEFSEHLHENRA